MKPFMLSVNGMLFDSANYLDVINPATEEVVAPCPVITRGQFEEVVQGAQCAYESWRNVPLDERRKTLIAIAEVIEQHSEELARILTAEQGKPYDAALNMEVAGSAIWCRTMSEMDIPVEVLSDSGTKRVELRHEPIGVVGGIVAWNAPLIISLWKLVPALLAGNSIIIKPSPYTPLTTLRFGELIQQVLPPGLVSIVTGTDELGQWMTEHPGIHKISFTGSVPTGKKVMQSASDTLKRITLELGGNDAGILLPDVDPKQVAEKVFWSAFANSGQICSALKRLYVHEDIYEETCQALVDVANTVKMGNGMDEGVALGPVQNKMQFEKVASLITEAREQGGRFLCGGEIPDGRGYFIPVTLIAGMTDGDRVVDEEPFGPVLPIIKYADVDDAIARANNTIYGLGASVWSTDMDAAIDVANRLEAGMVWVNEHSTVSPVEPFGGIKQSGMGVENSELGLLEFTHMKMVSINR